jgi:hypothetical protein
MHFKAQLSHARMAELLHQVPLKMTISLRALGIAGLIGLSSSAAFGQTQSSPTAQPSSATSSETRPATTTFQGDTGLWFVPTGEILGDRQWSASFYRRGKLRPGVHERQRFRGHVRLWTWDRAEIFGSLIFDTRIDRDLRPRSSRTIPRSAASSIGIRSTIAAGPETISATSRSA